MKKLVSAPELSPEGRRHSTETDFKYDKENST